MLKRGKEISSTASFPFQVIHCNSVRFQSTSLRCEIEYSWQFSGSVESNIIGDMIGVIVAEDFYRKKGGEICQYYFGSYKITYDFGGLRFTNVFASVCLCVCVCVYVEREMCMG